MSSEESFLVIAETATEKQRWLQDILEVMRDARRAAEAGKSTASMAGTTTASMAPIWQEDSEVKACTLCNTGFTLTKRRHHCRICGSVVCNSCSLSRLVHSGKPKRACARCVETVQQSKLGTLEHDTAEAFASRDSGEDTDTTPNGTLLHTSCPDQRVSC